MTTISTPDVCLKNNTAEREVAVLADLQDVLFAINRCPEGPLLDAIGMALCNLSITCTARADLLARAVKAGSVEMLDCSVRARLLAVATSQVCEMVRAKALGSECAGLHPAALRALDTALHRFRFEARR